MTTQVRCGSGTGIELLLAAAATADANWRRVFTLGPAAYTDIRRHDPTLVGDIRRLGRFGWINLVGPFAATRSGWSRARLVKLVAAMPPEELRWALVGGRRRQLRSRVEEDVVRSALDGERAALREFRTALDDSLLRTTPWLLGSTAEEIHATCLRVAKGMPDLDLRAPAAIATARALDRHGPEQLLGRVAPGIHYGPDVLRQVVLITCRRASPIIVAVDEVDQTVILHPPLTEELTDDPAARLRDIGRALGDDTRIRVLQQLRSGDRTLPELCKALEAPRTTLLHHMALLRSAGLVDLQVRAAAEPNVYSLGLSGFEALTRSARAFTAQSQMSKNLDT